MISVMVVCTLYATPYCNGNQLDLLAHDSNPGRHSSRYVALWQMRIPGWPNKVYRDNISFGKSGVIDSVRCRIVHMRAFSGVSNRFDIAQRSKGSS